jgi:ABC-2 type transport system permease protein
MSGGLLSRLPHWDAYQAEAKYECIRVLRAPGFSVPTLAVPVAFYLFFGIVLAETDRPLAIDLFIFAGFAVMGVMGPGLYGFGVFVATERAQGLFTLKRALPAPPLVYFSAKLVMTALFATFVTLALLLTAALAGRIALTPVRAALFAGAAIAGSLPFCAMGLAIGAYASGRSAPAIVNLMLLPMIYLSGILIPLPASFAAVRHVSPAYHLDQLALGALGGAASGGALTHVAVLTAMTGAFLGLSLWRFSHHD